MKKSIIFIVATVLIAGTAVFYFSQNNQDISKSSKTDTNTTNTNISQPANMETKTADRPVFSHDIFDVSKVSFITPIGELNGGYIESIVYHTL